MTPLTKGLLLAGLHVTLVCSLGAKLLYDRAHRPRLWIKVASADPNLPIRGRYLSLNLEVPAEGFTIRKQLTQHQTGDGGNPKMYEYLDPSRADLVLRNGSLVAVANPAGNYWVRQRWHTDDTTQLIVSGETAFFLPEHARDPSHLAAGEELWVEATIAKKGPPRPIRLAVKSNGVMQPVEMQ